MNDPAVSVLASAPWVALNDIYSSASFLAAVGIVLSVWTLWVGLPAWRAGGRLTLTLADMRGALARAGDSLDFARDYAQFAERFRADRLVGAAWGRLEQTLIKPDGDGKPYRQTSSARDAFNTDLLRSAGADLRAFRAHANTMVGVGLLLTFVGLVLALKAGAGTLAANDPSEVQLGLRALLDAAGSKFAFSVLGLSLSLLSAAWLRKLLRNTDAAIVHLLEALDRLIPPLTAVEVAVSTQLLLSKAASSQADAITGAVDLLGQRFDEALSKRLADATGPLTEAIARMTGYVGDNNRRALQEMADHFAARLEAVAAKDIREATLAMERVGAQVSALAETLGGVRDKFAAIGEAAARDISEAASDAVRRIADAADTACAALLAAGPGWQRASVAAADGLGARLADAAEQFAKSVKLGGEQLEEGGRKLSERLARAASDAGREIRGAGTALGAAGDVAGAALSKAAQNAATQVTAATGAVSSQAVQVVAAMQTIDVPVREVAAAMTEVRLTVTAAAALIERAAVDLESAGQRLGSLPEAALVLDELRASAARIVSAADGLGATVAAGGKVGASDGEVPQQSGVGGDGV